MGNLIEKFIERVLFVDNVFNSWYWEGKRPNDAFALKRLGHERWNVETNNWIKKSMEWWSASWLVPWRSSNFTFKLVLWRRLRVVGVFTCVAPSFPLAIASTKSSVFGFTLEGQANCFLDFCTFFALWLYLTPLKFEYVKITFSKFVSLNLSLSSCSNSMLVS